MTATVNHLNSELAVVVRNELQAFVFENGDFMRVSSSLNSAAHTKLFETLGIIYNMYICRG